MEPSRRRVLIAGLPPLMRDVQEALAADLSTASAQSLQEAQRRLDEQPPDCVVVAYHFDEMQAFRLIRHIREDPRLVDVPIILVCVLSYNLGAQEHEIRRAYQDLGVNAFVNLYEETRHHGTEAALARLRASVREAANGAAAPGGPAA